MLNAIPAQIILSMWLQFKMLLFGKTTLEFEIRGDAIQENMPFSLDIDDENMLGKNEAIPLIVKLPFNIKAVGEFTIYYRKKGDKEWSAAQTVLVRRNLAPTLQ